MFSLSGMDWPSWGRGQGGPLAVQVSGTGHGWSAGAPQHFFASFPRCEFILILHRGPGNRELGGQEAIA